MRLFGWFKKRPPSPVVWEPKRVFFLAEMKGWGDHISVLDAKQCCVYGHTTPRAQEGDAMVGKGASGVVRVWKLVNVKGELDPPDMWSANYITTDKDEAWARERSAAIVPARGPRLLA